MSAACAILVSLKDSFPENSRETAIDTSHFANARFLAVMDILLLCVFFFFFTVPGTNMQLKMSDVTLCMSRVSESKMK